MSTTTEAPPRERGLREPRCRMLTRLLDRCPNPALDPDPAAPQVCSKHAARIMQMVAERQAATRATARRAR